MGDVARCCCPHDAQKVRCGRDPKCPVHGVSAADPSLPWCLTAADKKFLRSLRITPQ
jgi:hypothetical protein